jgi:hypothetical protein
MIGLNLNELRVEEQYISKMEEKANEYWKYYNELAEKYSEPKIYFCRKLTECRNEKAVTIKDNMECYTKYIRNNILINSLVNIEKYEKLNLLPGVFLLSLICEKTFCNNIVEPIREFGEELLTILKIKDKSFIVKGLESWIQGKTKSTLGIAEMVICGIRYGLELDRDIIKSFILNNFNERYLKILGNKEFLKAISSVRNNFRNPACHGDKIHFTIDEYKQLSKLILSYTSCKRWLSSAPKIKPADIGLIHNLLISLKI